MTGARRRQGGSAVGITAWQLVWMVVTTLAIEDATVIDHFLAHVAGIDSWVSILVAAPMGLLGVWAIATLASRRRGFDLVAILRNDLGWLVYLLGPAFVLLFIADATLSSRTFVLVAKTLGEEAYVPEGAFLLLLIGTAMWGAWLGIEVVARVNTAVLWLVDVPLGIFLAALGTNHESLVRLLPILANGWGPIWDMAMFMLGKTGEFVVILVYATAVEVPAKLTRASLWGFCLLIVMALGHSVGPALTFGQSVSDVTWPSYSQIRAIEFGRFLQNLAVTAVIFWIHGFWLETTLFLDAAARTTAKVLGMRSHRKLLLVLGPVVFGLVYLIPTEAQALSERRLLDTWGFLILGLVVPILLLVISVLRGRASRTATPSRRGTPLIR